MTEVNKDLSNKSLLTADTRPTKKLLIEGITRDVSLEACICDLIDNAIDGKKEEGCCKIEVQLDSSRFSIKDNASGISSSNMANYALRFGGTATEERAGIGAFGIGLDRASFKLGKKIRIISESKDGRITVDLGDEYIHNDDKWDVPIAQIDKTGEEGTLIEITDLNDEVSKAFSNNKWANELMTGLSKRYGYFIQGKKCSINFNSTKVEAAVPIMREDGDFKILHHSRTLEGVMISIKLGQHHRHRFAYELSPSDKGINRAISRAISSEQGWSVYCNGRAIVLNDWTDKVGWDAKNHSQHIGFVGEVQFTGESILLPWSTSKEDVDIQNSLYVEALKTMRSYSEKWRAHTGKVRQGHFDNQAQLPLYQTSTSRAADTSASARNTIPISNNSNVGIQQTGDVKPTSELAPNSNNGLTKLRGKHNVKPHPAKTRFLFGETDTARIPFNVPDSETKIKAVVHELQKLPIEDYPCAIMLLLRVLVEESCKHYRKKNKVLLNLRNDTPLSEVVKRCLDSMINLRKWSTESDSHKITSTKALCEDRGKSLISIEYLQTNIHSSHSFLGADTIRSFWRDIEPFIVACFS